ncbi:MAG: hypothetical protein JXM70_02375, partial [Pirellulales bacterium]|nr:hypothetical protein [Pirellulales bacterium]
MRTAIILATLTLGSPSLVALAANPPSDALLGHWTFDRITHGQTLDSSLNGRHAKVVGVTATEGPHGPALAFDGDGNFVNIGDLGEQEAVTVAFWAKGQDDGRRERFQGLVTSDTWGPGVFHITIAAQAPDIYLHLGGDARGRLSGSRWKKGQWYHVAVTADTLAATI